MSVYLNNWPVQGILDVMLCILHAYSIGNRTDSRAHFETSYRMVSVISDLCLHISTALAKKWRARQIAFCMAAPSISVILRNPLCVFGNTYISARAMLAQDFAVQKQLSDEQITTILCKVSGLFSSVMLIFLEQLDCSEWFVCRLCNQKRRSNL